MSVDDGGVGDEENGTLSRTRTGTRGQLMTESGWEDGNEISLFALGTMLVRRRRGIAWWMFGGGVLAALSVFSLRPMYVGSASFIPQGGDAGRSGLATLAGQFGGALPSTSSQSSSPDFYAALLKSRVVLAQITRDTFVVQELGGRRMSFFDLFGIRPGPALHREEAGVSLLRALVTPTVVKTTGVVEVSVETRWPSVSLAMTRAVLDAVMTYNQQTRQGQAAAERKFVEGRLAIANASLRETEDRLEKFTRMNRQISSSPELTLERERIQRDLSLKQQVYTALTQSYEDARIREVRDTPVITVFEPPTVPSGPRPSGRTKRVLLGILLGGFVGVSLVLMSAIIGRQKSAAEPDTVEFFGALEELKRSTLRPIRRFWPGIAS
jgi:uncharacterized protein involved in exopolysaccharide biosynthesis